MNEKPLRTGRQLADAGIVSDSDIAAVDTVAERYSVALTSSVVDLIKTNDPDAAIARQFVPDVQELTSDEQELTDPIGDKAHSPLQGIVHRYPDRVLLTPTHICSVYCRYCFRREFVGSHGEGTLSTDELTGCLDYIREHEEIWEVILTGGDPLTLSVRRLRTILTELDAIPHVRVIRIHTRIPTVAPERISNELLQLFRELKTTLYVLLHINHASELSDAAQRACASLVDIGVPLLSQSVLLRGVNDNIEVLGTLLRTLVEHRIKPYYLHHCDLASGTAHFRVSIEKGQALMRELRGRYSGLCLPEYVLDIPGGAGKSPIGPNYLTRIALSDNYKVEDYNGAPHDYRCCG